MAIVLGEVEALIAGGWLCRICWLRSPTNQVTVEVRGVEVVQRLCDSCLSRVMPVSLDLGSGGQLQGAQVVELDAGALLRQIEEPPGMSAEQIAERRRQYEEEADRLLRQIGERR